MKQETKLANELQSMITQNLVAISAQEDINEITDQLSNGKITISDLEKSDPFVVDIVHEAMNRKDMHT